MKVYIYCTKAKPYLKDFKFINEYTGTRFYVDNKIDEIPAVNGKVVACFDLNKIEKINLDEFAYKNDHGINFGNAMMTPFDIWNYVKSGNREKNFFYAWHIENVKALDKPIKLYDFAIIIDIRTAIKKGIIEKRTVELLSDDGEIVKFAVEKMAKGLKNWCYANLNGERCIIISINPKWLVKILNGEKTIEIRKTALKEMIK